MKFGLAALAAVAFTPSVNAQSVSINYDPTGALPAYAAGTVIQEFTYTSPGNNVPANAANLPALDLHANVPASTTQTVSSSTNVRLVTGNISTARGTNTSATGGTGVSGGYLAVLGGGSYTLDFGTSGVQFLSFVFGGLDTYNKVTLNLSGVASPLVLTGAQIIGGSTATALPLGTGQAAGASGNSLGVFGRVSYDAGGAASILSAVFSSSSNTFEIDSIAAAAPEPGTWAMMLLGFGVVGSQLRRRRKTGAAVLAAA